MSPPVFTAQTELSEGGTVDRNYPGRSDQSGQVVTAIIGKQGERIMREK